MDEQTAKSVAAQLRKPQGEWADRIAEFMARGNLVLIQRCIDVLLAGNNDNVLEIGMGNGAHIESIIKAENNVQYTGYDYSEEMVQLASKINEGFVAKKRATFVHGNAMAMPFGDDSFDKLLTVNTVYFWDDVAAVAAEIKRVLKPGGELVIGLRPERLMQDYPMTKYGFELYTAENVQQLLQGQGFTIVSVAEESEPEQELEGEMLQLASLIVKAHI